jgi:hypothetical protein
MSFPFLLLAYNSEGADMIADDLELLLLLADSDFLTVFLIGFFFVTVLDFFLVGVPFLVSDVLRFLDFGSGAVSCSKSSSNSASASDSSL